ncbi:DUF547 domain-containing protein [Gaetbulibacter aestuarii]
MLFLLSFVVFPKTALDSDAIQPKTAQKVNHMLWTNLLQKHVSNDGHVNYRGFKKDWPALKNYITILGKQTPQSNWSKPETLAYWINAYNALTIDLILRHDPVNSIKDIRNPWKQELWTLDDKTYDLDFIEHQILRKMQEPRIHFAIVCASYSCPKLRNSAYKPDHLNDQLDQAAKDFINDPKRNDLSENSIEISKIFQWFRSDFEQHGSLIDFLNRFADIEVSKNARIRFKNYNWDLND